MPSDDRDQPPARASKSRRGFAAMSAERQREIASKGGKSVLAEKRSFSRDPELAAEAGRKGGKRSLSRQKVLHRPGGGRSR
jgi:general stress protein YciG